MTVSDLLNEMGEKAKAFEDIQQWIAQSEFQPKEAVPVAELVKELLIELRTLRKVNKPVRKKA